MRLITSAGRTGSDWHSVSMELRTPRLLVRDWREADAQAALDIQGRPEVMRWLGDGEPRLATDLDDARSRIQRWRSLDEPPLGFWAVEVHDGGDLEGRVIGSVLLVRLPGDTEVEIGWHLHPDAWGRGYAAEAARPVLERGLAAGLARIHAVTHLTNHRSQSVCRKLGMRHLGVTERWYESPSEHFVRTAGDPAPPAGTVTEP